MVFNVFSMIMAPWCFDNHDHQKEMYVRHVLFEWQRHSESTFIHSTDRFDKCGVVHESRLTCKNTSDRYVPVPFKKGGKPRQNSQNAPKSGPKTAQSVPNPSQTEPQDFPKSDYPSHLGVVCFWSQICIFVLQFCGRMCLFFKEPTFKIHAPTQCFVDFHTFGHISKKLSKIVEKSSRNPPQIVEKSRKIRKNRWQKPRWVRKANKCVKNAKKVPTWPQ